MQKSPPAKQNKTKNDNESENQNATFSSVSSAWHFLMKETSPAVCLNRQSNNAFIKMYSNVAASF